MTTPTSSLYPLNGPRALLNQAWQANWPLTLISLGSAALLIFATVMVLFDPRLITGAPAWFKPMKFALSIMIYSLTLVWMLGYVKGHPRLVALVSAVTAIGFVVELALLTLQVVRGVRSHFNVSTPFDSAIFSIMGILIVVVWLMTLLTAALVMRQKFTDPVFAWSLRLGLLVSAVGMVLAFLMPRPTPEQLAVMQAGGAPVELGAHAVGVPDGGPGLPFVGWSTEGGDLRVPHFIGMHGLQVLPVLGLVVNRAFATLSARRRIALMFTGGLGYLGLILALTWQALRGQSIIAPDALTLGVFAGLIGAVVVVGAVVVGSARRVAGRA